MPSGTAEAEPGGGGLPGCVRPHPESMPLHRPPQSEATGTEPGGPVVAEGGLTGRLPGSLWMPGSFPSLPS